jgi:tryptophanyl-tRNA synthetase
MARVVTGFRPTGRLHLGHLVGNVETMRGMQDDHECYFFVADWHALTTDFGHPEEIGRNTRELVLDLMAAGIDPFRVTIYKQSDVPEVAELSLFLSMITPLGWLERNPTYKEQRREAGGLELATHGFLGYPVLQCADIAIVGGELVPVGSDQVPHLELTREILRRFNRLYGTVFPEPQPIPGPIIKGTDGRKMSKSFHNTIWLDDDPAGVTAAVNSAITDPAKVRRGDPGNPEICTVYHWWRLLFADQAARVAPSCIDGSLGCVEDKTEFATRLAERLAPIRERRAELEAKPGFAEEVLSAGSAKVRRMAGKTLEVVRDAMKLPHTKRTPR